MSKDKKTNIVVKVDAEDGMKAMLLHKVQLLLDTDDARLMYYAERFLDGLLDDKNC